MKKTLAWYMDLAKKRNDLKSDRKLAVALGLSSLGPWRLPHRHVVPEIGVMIRLAKLCAIPEEIALIDRDIWEATHKAPESVPIYEKIKETLKKLPHIAAMLSLCIAITVGTARFDPAQAIGMYGNASAGGIYIMEYLLTDFKRPNHS